MRTAVLYTSLLLTAGLCADWWTAPGRGGGCRYLCLIGVSNEPRFEVERPLVDHNVQVFQDCLLDVFARNPR